MKITTATWKVTMADLEAFRGKLEAYVNELKKKRFPTLPAEAIEVEVGPRYARLIRVDHGSRCAYGFVDMTTGDLLKAAGWKAPAKHSRGNLFGDNPLAGCGPYGMAYLR